MDLDELYRLLRVAHVQAQGVMDTMRTPVLVVDGDMKVLSANRAFYETFKTGRDETICRPFSELGDGQWRIPDLELLLHRVIPKSASVFDYEVTAAFPAIGKRTMLVSGQRLVHRENGEPLMLLSFVDATEQRARDDAKDRLVHEIRHRVQNLMAVAIALARQTSTEGITAGEYREAFLERFSLLARALELSLTGEASRLPDFARAILAPYILSGRLKVDCDVAVPLSSHFAMPLGMILHELATNALKYGGLSNGTGTVTVDWSIDQDPDRGGILRLSWCEADGPKTRTPNATGFGTRLITSAVEELGGTLEQDYRPDGLNVYLVLPLGESLDGRQQRGPSPDPRARG